MSRHQAKLTPTYGYMVEWNKEPFEIQVAGYATPEAAFEAAIEYAKTRGFRAPSSWIEMKRQEFEAVA